MSATFDPSSLPYEPLDNQRKTSNRCTIIGAAAAVVAVLLVAAASLTFLVLRPTTAPAPSQPITHASVSSPGIVTAGGEYNITGVYSYSLIYNTTDAVTLNLYGCVITSSNTSAIQQLGTGALNINVMDGTTNVLSDGGTGKYPGCIYSYGPLTIGGTGFLNVTANQKEGEAISTEETTLTIKDWPTIVVTSPDDGINTGTRRPGVLTINGGNITVFATGDGIDADGSMVINDGFIYTSSKNMDDTGLDSNDGFAINGGTVVSLGMGIFEAPVNSSKQYCFALRFNVTIPANTLITMTDSTGKVYVSFISIVQCNQIILSLPSFTLGTYHLYQGGSNTALRAGYFYDTSDSSTFTPGTLVAAANTTSFVISSTSQKVYVYNSGGPGPRPPWGAKRD